MRYPISYTAWILRFVTGHLIVIVPILGLISLLLRIPPADLRMPFLTMLVPSIVGGSLLFFTQKSTPGQNLLPLFLSITSLLYLIFMIWLTFALSGKLGYSDTHTRHLFLWVGLAVAIYASGQIYYLGQRKMKGTSHEDSSQAQI